MQGTSFSWRTPAEQETKPNHTSTFKIDLRTFWLRALRARPQARPSTQTWPTASSVSGGHREDPSELRQHPTPSKSYAKKSRWKGNWTWRREVETGVWGGISTFPIKLDEHIMIAKAPTHIFIQSWPQKLFSVSKQWKELRWIIHLYLCQYLRQPSSAVLFVQTSLGFTLCMQVYIVRECFSRNFEMWNCLWCWQKFKTIYHL